MDDKAYKQIKLAIIARDSYYHNLLGYPPEKTWEELNWLEQQEWFRMVEPIMKYVNNL